MPLDTPSDIASALDDASRKPAKAKAKGKTRPPKVHRPRKESTKAITNRLYALWSSIVHQLYGNKCAVTGETGVLDAHHIIPRQICSGLRFDPRNGILLSKSAHKFGRRSAHKNGLWFASWLKANHPDVHAYCLCHMDDELDCKNRMDLYLQESVLHHAYPHQCDPLPSYSVTALMKDGSIAEEIYEAYNAKAAETMFDSLHHGRVKGIVKVYTSSPAPVNREGNP